MDMNTILNPAPPKRFKFSDDVMFSLIMADKQVCGEVIMRIIGNEIGEIRHIITQRTLVNKPRLKYTRFDVCVETTDGKLYDVEIQISDKHNLERRMRYYQSMLSLSKTSVFFESAKKYNLRIANCISSV